MDKLKAARLMYFRDSIKRIFLTNRFIQKKIQEKISENTFNLYKTETEKNNNNNNKPILNPTRVIEKKIVLNKNKTNKQTKKIDIIILYTTKKNPIRILDKSIEKKEL